MSTENYINLAVSEEQIRVTVLTNICRMMIRRGYIDGSKYLNDSTKKKENVPKIVAPSPSEYDIYDNVKILKLLSEHSDNGVYIIPLDHPYPDENETERDGEGHVEFDSKHIVVKIINQVVKDVSNSPILNDFFKSHAKYHKIVVFDDIADKVYGAFRKHRNAEVFSTRSLMMDIMSHMMAPISCNFVTQQELSFMINTKFAWMHENDPLCRYYAGKTGQIMRIVRPSINNMLSVSYRRIDDPKPGFNM